MSDAQIFQGNLLESFSFPSASKLDMRKFLRSACIMGRNGSEDSNALSLRHRRFDRGEIFNNSVNWTCPISTEIKGNVVYELSQDYNRKLPQLRSYKWVRGRANFDRGVVRIAKHLAALTTIDGLCPTYFKVQVHIIHYFPNELNPAKATPSWPHKDGVKWTSIILLHQENIVSPLIDFYIDKNVGDGANITKVDGEAILKTHLYNPLDFLLWNDELFFHDVSNIRCKDEKPNGDRIIMILDIIY